MSNRYSRVIADVSIADVPGTLETNVGVSIGVGSDRFPGRVLASEGPLRAGGRGRVTLGALEVHLSAGQEITLFSAQMVVATGWVIAVLEHS